MDQSAQVPGVFRDDHVEREHEPKPSVLGTPTRWNGDEYDRSALEIDHGRSALAFPGRDVREHGRTIAPRAAILMDVTEQVKARRDLGNPCAQIGAAGAIPDGRAIRRGRRVASA